MNNKYKQFFFYPQYLQKKAAEQKLTSIAWWYCITTLIVLVLVLLAITPQLLENQKKVSLAIKPLEMLVAMSGEPTRGNNEVYVRSITAQVSAYSELDSCHTKTDTGECITKSGRILKRDMDDVINAMLNKQDGVIACPREIPFGHRVVLSTDSNFMGVFICEDRTAEYIDGRFDVWFGYGDRAHEAAKKFGVQKMNVDVYRVW